MAHPGVVFLDDDEDLRELFVDVVALFAERDCLTVGSVDELVEQRKRVLAAELIILDINLGPGLPSGLDAYKWLREQNYGGRVVFLTGHAASHPLVAEARRLAGVRVYEKPLPVPTIARLLEREPD
ncbi:response regulator [Nannocystis bainbridge]|uniref:Response regulator n=1 Tax=Nannocystis bainbridge TaxID=2995303 RepID=A0ABT5DW16_9BACT|nr:response regulator [Nannocystis bainbridge]MDC0716913.1 response regulator [Nannocystis bainbridge]